MGGYDVPRCQDFEKKRKNEGSAYISQFEHKLTLEIDNRALCQNGVRIRRNLLIYLRNHDSNAMKPSILFMALEPSFTSSCPFASLETPAFISLVEREPSLFSDQ